MYRGYDSRYYSGQRPKPKAEPEPKLSKPELVPERGRDLCRIKRSTRSRSYWEYKQSGDYGG